MYISKLRIKGYRNYDDKTIEFNDGINMIIGPNNGGKTNLLRALRLIFEPHCRFRRMTVTDFHRPVGLEELKSASPRIVITASIKPSQNPDKELDDDIRLVRMWLTTLDDDYEAKLSYVCELPSQYEDEYKKVVSGLLKAEDIWNVIDQDFIRRYKYFIVGGDVSRMEKADTESLSRFDVQSLDALRNVENELTNSRSSLLKEVIDFYIDFEIRNDINLSSEEKEKEQKRIRDEFKTNSGAVINHLIDRLKTGKEHMLQYASYTGASFNNATPDFNGDISEQDLYSALRIIVKYQTGVELPVSHNGLGYNNLIFISLILAKIQADTDIKRMGENVISYPILVIEEPEAHLHPSMQYKFLSFLRENQTSKVRQIFVTTHSTQIASAVPLKELICVQRGKNEDISIAYPYKTFLNTQEGSVSYRYVQRFLDATRSDMLFADKVIFVEGIAEQLMLDVMARYCEFSLADNHVCVVNVGGRYFEHFLRMFDTKSSPYALNKRVLCLTDIDPTRKEKNEKSFSRCYPFEMDVEPDMFDYARNPFVGDGHAFSEVENIFITHQDIREGKTFEYDIILHNPKSKWLINQEMRNSESIIELMECNTFAEAKDKFGNAKWKQDVLTSLDKCDWSDDQKLKALIAAYYLKSVPKGENALITSHILTENLSKSDIPDEYNEFVVPQYIEEGLSWLLK